MQYNYTDSRNNSYLIKDSKIKYSPITKEQSSSGTYDGGKPFQKELTKMDLIRIVDVMERSIWATSDHIDKREMGSSYLRKPDMEVKLFLRYNSSSQIEIQKILRSFHI